MDAAGTPFTFHPQATDNLDAAPRITVAPIRESYPLGDTPVTFTATDWAGNTTVLTSTVRVRDTQEPTLVVDPEVLREANDPNGTAVQLSPAAWDISYNFV